MRDGPGEAPHGAPRATYRVQLSADFDFGAAARIVPYLADLGISHLYVSPILQAVPGSRHGYDVVDHGRISADLGGEAAFAGLAATLRTAGMGLIVDVVPNHMAIAGPSNRWWWDVLENGLASPWADYFDVDWDSPEDRLRNVILLPVLDDHYGRLLEAGRIRLVRRDGAVEVRSGSQRFPVDLHSLAGVVSEAAGRCDSAELAFIGRTLAELPATPSLNASERDRWLKDTTVLQGRLAALIHDGPATTAFDAALAALNADVDAVDQVLNEQHYRLAWWRASSRDLGYRRFFDVNTLIGLRVEREEVFEATHRLILEQVAAGAIQGLRIDHIDGLRDPAAYLARLRSAAPAAWIVVEKILASDEALPAGWPVDGTTGYELGALATALLVEPRGLAILDRHWAAAAPDLADWTEVARTARLEVSRDALGSDLNRITALLLGVCEANRRYRDFTRHDLHEALPELIAGFDVYRTYARPGDSLSAVDRAVIERAVRRAIDRRPDLDPELFVFIGAVLRLEVPGDLATELALRFQQLTPAAMAKGIEDTALYRYLRLTALNEVGANPATDGMSLEAVHSAMATAARRSSRAMRATSTHDTKRSEDVRARIACLAGQAELWGPFVERLDELTSAHWPGERGPDAHLLELLAQTAVGSWPIGADRLTAYLIKAVREARLRTSWTAPDAAYEAALAAGVGSCLADPAWVAAMDGFAAPLRAPARDAALVQLLFKLATPGVPDMYQGTELWDDSLVDPDNRRPVDFDRRRQLLAELSAGLTPEEILARADEGLPKLWLLQSGLALRTRRPAVFGPKAGYRPLPADGAKAGKVVAFLREDAVAGVAPRWPVALVQDGWGATTVDLPPAAWRNVLDGARWPGGPVRLDALLDRFPVALLERIG